jgi:hypothetical protein
MSLPARVQMLLDSAKLERVAFTDEQVVGLWEKALEAYTDSSSSPRSWNGQFRDLYEGGRLAATAFVAAAGFRAKGAGHHRTTITAAAELSPDEVADAFYTVEGARGNRHATNYGSEDVVDEEDVAEIREALRVLMRDGAQHLRSLRPGAAGRIPDT